MQRASMSAASAQPRSFFGTHVVRAAFVLAIFGWGVGFYGPPIFLYAVVERTGWPLVTVSSAVTLHFLFGAIVVVNLPRAYRRFGVPATIVTGACIAAAGIVGWATAAAPWQLFVAALASGGGWVAMGAVAINAVIARWYERRRPIALALIASAGFPSAAALVGIATIVVAAALAWFVFSKGPEQLGQLRDGDAPGSSPVTVESTGARPLPGRTLLQDRRFLTLAAAMAIGLFVQVGLIAHLFNLLAPAIGAQRAGVAMALATACAIGGRAAVARLLGTGSDRRLAACAAYLVQMIGALVLAGAGEQSVGFILLGVLLFGSGIGNATSLPPLIAQVEFARDDVPRVIALIVGIAQAAYAFAPAAFGVLLALWSGDDVRFGRGTGVFFVTAAILQCAAIGALLAGRSWRARR